MARLIIPVLIPVISVLLTLLVVKLILNYLTNRKNANRFAKLISLYKEMTTNQFFYYYDNFVRESRAHPEQVVLDELNGLIVIYNVDKNKYFVKQADHFWYRGFEYLKGRVNEEMANDILHKDRFTIRLIPIKNSGFLDLNELEQCGIAYYDAFKYGYNRIQGIDTGKDLPKYVKPVKPPKKHFWDRFKKKKKE